MAAQLHSQLVFEPQFQFAYDFFKLWQLSISKVSVQEMTSFLEDMMQRQVNQPHIEGPVLCHQRTTQMIDRRIPGMILPVGPAFLFKERVLPRLIFRPEPCRVHALKEGRIHPRNLCLE